MIIDEFINSLKELNIEIDSNKLKQLEKYYELLIKWNEKMNLTGITKKEEVYLKHFYDSSTFVKAINLKENLSLCDIGTGAGFPGIVLKILFPNLSITLVDSLGKRINFLKEVKQELQLENLDIIEARAEEYAKEVREIYDIVTSRAVAHLHILMEYSIPLVKKNGYFIPMKGNAEEELKDLDKLKKELNVKYLDKIEFELPYSQGKRTLPIFQKLEKTKTKYPRKYSDIKKKPL